MAMPPATNTPAPQQYPSTSTGTQSRAGVSSLLHPRREPAIGKSPECDSDGKIVDEQVQVDPAGLIAELMQRLLHLVEDLDMEELERAAGADAGPACAIALLPHLAEILKMRTALRVQMDLEKRMSISVRMAEISCDGGSVQEELAKCLGQGGVAGTGLPNAEPAGQ